MAMFSQARPSAPRGLSVLLLGAATPTQDEPLADLKSRLLEGFLLASRLRVSLDGLEMLCGPALSVADVAERLLQGDLPLSERRAAWRLYLGWAARDAGHVEVINRAQVAAAGLELEELPEALSAWRAHLERTLGPFGVAQLSAATRALLDGATGAGRALQRQASLEALLSSLYGDAVEPALRLLRAVGDYVEALSERGWGDPGDDPLCQALASRLQQRDAEAASAPAPELPEAAWEAVAEAAMALDPTLIDRAPSRARALDALRQLAQRSERGLMIFVGPVGQTPRGGPALACAQAKATSGSASEPLAADGALTAEDLRLALGSEARRWTVLLDASPRGGGGPPLDPRRWTRAGLPARVLGADAAVEGGLTWALRRVLSGHASTQTPADLPNGELIQRTNQLLEALACPARACMSAPEPVSELPFLGLDPRTAQASQSFEDDDPFEIWAGSNEIMGLEVLDPAGVRKLVVFATQAEARFGWTPDVNAVLQNPSWRLRVVLSTDIDGKAAEWAAWASKHAVGGKLRTEVATSPAGGLFVQNPSSLTPVGKRFQVPGMAAERRISFLVVGSNPQRLRVFLDAPPRIGLISPAWFELDGPDQSIPDYSEAVKPGWLSQSYMDIL